MRPVVKTSFAILVCSTVLACSASMPVQATGAVPASSTAQGGIATQAVSSPRAVERILVCTQTNTSLCAVECTRLPKLNHVREVFFLSNNSSAHTTFEVFRGGNTSTHVIGPNDSCWFSQMIDPNETRRRG
jgi:hypothetical protein